ncbi:unnamed protein product [Staurois parvus]|uniref:Uncharacterized protein n=1 Tax=Staurois parvus TaxID=386267 RepID=A0ABN9G9L0_9NEOB|nr:unnamed protein product [Staurois parvus]
MYSHHIRCAHQSAPLHQLSPSECPFTLGIPIRVPLYIIFPIRVPLYIIFPIRVPPYITCAP